MKSFLTNLFLTIGFLGFAQHPFFPDQEIKPGFYKNFTEFRMNTPSTPFSESLKIERAKNLLDKELVQYRVVGLGDNLDKALSKKYGFFDGKDFYISHAVQQKDFKRINGYVFNKLYSIGRYACYESRVVSSSYSMAAGGTMSSSSNVSTLPFMLDVNTSEVYQITNSLLKSILKGNTARMYKHLNNIERMSLVRQYSNSLSSELGYPNVRLVFYRTKERKLEDRLIVKFLNGEVNISDLSIVRSEIPFNDYLEIYVENGENILVSLELGPPMYFSCTYDKKTSSPKVELTSYKKSEPVLDYIKRWNAVLDRKKK